MGWAVAAGLLLLGRAALAQACCVGGALTNPSRLAPYDSVSVGLQALARDNRGAFDASGHFASSSTTDQEIQEQLLASLRLAARDQVGAALPIVQNHRVASGIDEWGAGVGDLALTYRHDFLLATEALYWPGVALLSGVTFPTGTPPDQSTSPLATDATGAGTYDVSIGIAFEKVHRHLFLELDNWLTHRFDRTVEAGAGQRIDESFALRWTALASAGCVFDSEAAIAAYVTFLDEGASTLDGAVQPTPYVRETTAGIALGVPVRDHWRLQATLFSDVMLSSFGRNQLAGLGVTVAEVWRWF